MLEQHARTKICPQLMIVYLTLQPFDVHHQYCLGNDCVFWVEGKKPEDGDCAYASKTLEK